MSRTTRLKRKKEEEASGHTTATTDSSCWGVDIWCLLWLYHQEVRGTPPVNTASYCSSTPREK